MKIRCNECLNMIEPIIKEGGLNWFDSYFCPNCKGMEIARKSTRKGKEDDFVFWNGYEFKRSAQPT